MTDKRVTIVCVAYNQERFIKQALDSLVMQKTNFDYEVLVGDDASTDMTSDIIKDFSIQYPDKITAILREKNVGAAHNSIDLYSRVKTEYVAVCDGDDYWCDEYKLQKQVDFLDKHQDFATVFGKSRVFFDDGSQKDSFLPSKDANYDFITKNYIDASDILRYNDITPVSLMWRWTLGNGFPEWYSENIMGDLALNLIHARQGKVGFIPDVMSCYRRHSGGIWQGGDDFAVSYRKYAFVLMNTFVNLKKHYEGKFKESFDKSLQHVFFMMFKTAKKDNDSKLYADFISKFFPEYMELFEALYARTSVDDKKHFAKKIKKLKKVKKILIISMVLTLILVLILSSVLVLGN